jgi:hypothetical protein
MDVIVIKEGAGVVLRNPKGAIQQRFSIFLPRGYAHERNGCSVPGPAPSVREEGFCIAIAYDLLFSILKGNLGFRPKLSRYCRGWFDVEAMHGGAGRFPRASCIFDSGIISYGGPEV